MKPPRPALSSRAHVISGVPAGRSKPGGRGTIPLGLSTVALAAPHTKQSTLPPVCADTTVNQAQASNDKRFMVFLDSIRNFCFGDSENMIAFAGDCCEQKLWFPKAKNGRRKCGIRKICGTYCYGLFCTQTSQKGHSGDKSGLRIMRCGLDFPPQF